MARGNALNNIFGVTDGGDATAGDVGEYISGTLAQASAISLTTVTEADITSIILTAGDWDVSGFVAFTAAPTTTGSLLYGWINTVSVTSPVIGAGNNYCGGSIDFTGSQSRWWCMGPQRISIASTTTVYLGAYSQFTTSTMEAWGHISARRVR
jgi:hypothetical protein